MQGGRLRFVAHKDRTGSMKSQILTIFSLFGICTITAVGQSAKTAPPAGAATTHIPVRPMQPTPPLQPVTPPNQNPNQPSQTPPPTQPNGAAATGFITNSTQPVPRFGAGTNQLGNPLSTASNQPISSNGIFAQTTNQFGQLTNQFGFGTNGAGPGTNPIVLGTNSFATGTNPFAFGTNLLSTNHLVRDEAATPQDRRLLAHIRRELLPAIRRERVPIHLIAQNGVVTLVGFTISTSERQQIESIVQQTPGVVSVVDNLQVSQGMNLPEGNLQAGDLDQDRDDRDFAANDHDRDLLRHARREMERRRGEFGELGSVHFISQNGVVTLVGSVNSPQEKQALEKAIQAIPGVVSINDQLTVSSQASTTSTTPSATVSNTGAAGLAGQFGPPFNNPSRFNGTNQFGFAPNGGPFLFTNREGFVTNLSPTGFTNFPRRIFYNPTNPPPLQR